MHDRAALIDAAVLTRTAGILDRSRRQLPPEAMIGFAREIVTRVAEVVALRAQDDGVQIDADRIAEFCDLLLQPDQPRTALGYIVRRRDAGASLRDVYLGYIGQSAALLGERWENDELTPLQVTIGAGTLYALMRALRRDGAQGPVGDPRRAALFATVPGEQHGLGITVAADLFRDAGWEIDLQLGLGHAALVDRARRARPDIVGLSLSGADRLADLARLVVALRLVVPGALLGVAPGSLSAEDVDAVVDVDVIFGDAPSAIAQLERHIAGH